MKKIDWHEIRRKSLHIVGGLIISSLIYFDLIKSWMVLVALIVGIISSILYLYFKIPFIHFFLSKFERKHLIQKFPGKGLVYLFIAVFLLMITFEKTIVVAAIMIWTFGDSMSAIVGKHYGSIRNPLNNSRLVEGTVAGIICGTIAASFFVYWIYALVAATIAMIIESVDWKLYHASIDDNFFVPVIAAFIIQLLLII